MSKGYGLCSLQMGVSGHYGLRMLFSNIYYSVDKLSYKLCYLICFILEIKLDIKRYLIVSASCCMQALSCVADSCCKFRLDKHMDIFGIGIEGQLTAFDVAQDTVKAVNYCLAVGSADYSALTKHSSVSYRTFYIMLIHSCIK